MTLRSLQVPSVLGGVTQQPRSLARPDRVKRARNVFPFPDRGLCKRPGSSWLATLETNDYLDVALNGLDLGLGDRYQAVFSNENVRVFGPAGTEYSVLNSSAGGTPSFTYLNLRNTNRLTGAENFTTGWLLNQLPLATLANAATTMVAGTRTPLGWRARPSGADANEPNRYTRLEIDAAASGSGDYSQVITGGLLGGICKLAVYFNTSASPLCQHIQLYVVDDWNTGAGTFTHSFGVTFTWSSPTSLPTIAETFAGSGDAGSLTGRVEQLGTNDFRCMLVLDTARAQALIGAQDGLVAVRMFIPNVSTVEQIYAWGAMFVDNQPDLTNFPAYAEDPHILRTLPVVDTTFVANPMITTAAGSTLSSTKATVLGNWGHFPGAAGNFAQGDCGFIWVRQGLSGALIKFDLKFELISGGTITRVQDEVTTASADVHETARVIAARINAVIGSTLDDHVHAVVIGATADTSAAGNRSSVVVVRVRDTYRLLSIAIDGGTVSTMAVAFHDEIETVSDLPLFCIDGISIKLVGEDNLADSSIDAYSRAILRFRETNKLVTATGVGSTDEFLGSAGFWEEGTDYAVTTDFNDATLPHILVRRQDNAAGAVTGVPYQIFFSWEQYGWDDRLVGSNERNPAPSFIGKRIYGLGLFENRLVLTADQNPVMSEAGVFDNFWRTTLRTLPASERIDVAVSGSRENTLRHVAVAQGNLFVLGEESVHVAEFGDLLSPQSIGFSQVSSFGSALHAAPAPSGALLIYAVPDRKGYARVEGLLRTRDQTESLPLSSEVPEFVPNNALAIEAHSGTGLTFFLSSDRTKLRVLRVLQSGADVVQNAWFELDFGSDGIAGMALLHDELFLAVRRGDKTYLESIPLATTVTDDGESFHAHLDCRVTEDACTVSFSSPNTTVTLPYTVTDATKLRIVRRNPILTDGTGYTVVTRTATTIVVSGDITAHEFFVGLALEPEIEPLTPAVFESGRTFEGRAPRPSAVEVLRRLTLELTETGSASLAVTYGGSTTTESYSQNDPLDPSRTELQTVVGGAPDEVTVVLSDDSHFPFALTAMEWEAEVALRS